MFPTEWTIKAHIRGNFRLGQSQHLAGAPQLGFKSLRVLPDYDEKNQPKGTHEIELLAAVAFQEGVHQAVVVMEYARAAIDHIAAMLALASGSRVEVLGEISAIQYDIQDPRKGRAVLPGQGVSIGPPATVVPDVLGRALDSSVQRAVWWFAQALRAHDPADGFMALVVSLELLAAAVVAPGGRQRKCEKCGFVKNLDPGLREKVVHFLMSEGQVSHEVAEDIYEARIDLMHGRARVDEEFRRRLRKHSTSVVAAIRNGVARRASCAAFPSMKVDLFDVHSAFLFVEFTRPETSSADGGWQAWPNNSLQRR